MARLIWVSDSPTTPSGFGTVTREICGRLRDRGHHVEIIGWQTHGVTARWNDIPVHPVRHDRFGADVLYGYLMRIRPDFVISLADVWWMAHLADPQIQAYFDMSGTRWVHYFPVDGATSDGLLPQGWAELLQSADVPVAMSRWGQQVACASGVDAQYIPHGVDLDTFAPPADKTAAKRLLGYDGRFIVLSDARNQPRKLLPRTVDVLRILAGDSRYDDVLFHLHCDPYDPAAEAELYSYSLLQDLGALDLIDRVRFTAGFRMRPGGGVSPTQLASLYRAADAHLLSSWGEGFGLPSLQAAAAGVVPIAVAATASRELVQGHGFAIPVESTMCDEFGMERALLSREHAAGAIAALHDDPAMAAQRSRDSRQFALGYSWDTLCDEWVNLLNDVPARRRVSRSRQYAFTTGGTSDASAPSVVREALAPSLAGLATGTSVRVSVTERRQGEAIGRIRAATFREGRELSIPVRLPPLDDGQRDAHVGWVLAGPGSLPELATIQKIFPSTRIAVTTPDLDIETPERLPLSVLLESLAAYALVVDHGGDACAGLDTACAVLGVPYHGASPWWPPVIGSLEPDDTSAIRRLLTDQGLSQWRRRVARAAVVDGLDPATIDEIERIATPQPAARDRDRTEAIA